MLVAPGYSCYHDRKLCSCHVRFPLVIISGYQKRRHKNFRINIGIRLIPMLMPHGYAYVGPHGYAYVGPVSVDICAGILLFMLMLDLFQWTYVLVCFCLCLCWTCFSGHNFYVLVCFCLCLCC